MCNDVYKIQNGYVIQLYQYARRYRYNYKECIKYYNKEKQNDNRSESAYATFGDFDVLEVIPVDSFRKYHDVSDLAKGYLGRRQSILLYRIPEDESDTLATILYDPSKRYWKTNSGGSDIPIYKRFFCFSMLSFTNEIHEKVDVFRLLPQLRKQIRGFIDDFNDALRDDNRKLDCEVFGALNATELGIVWLCNQYTDVLQLIDYIKHMKIEIPEDSGQISIPCFLATNTTISTKLDQYLSEEERQYTVKEQVKGSAIVQISIHDAVETRDNMVELIDTIKEAVKKQSVPESEYTISYAAGEYDITIQLPAGCALNLMQYNEILNNAKRQDEQHGFQFEEELREILRNHTQLLYAASDVDELKNLVDIGTCFDAIASIKLEKTDPAHSKLLVNVGNACVNTFEELTDVNEDGKRSNHNYYQTVRREMAQIITSSAGLIDMLDLLYTDYLSVISSAYNKIWVADFHRQFKAVLHVIELWIQQCKNNYEDAVIEEDFNQFKELTNAFKQQVYHLAQSSRMVLDLPRCHFRMTGQYDLLMHTYYGFAKVILEAIYLMQGRDHQSELVPLITVNTVPQVKSQLFFEYGKNDERRVINLDIPASIVFVPQRGFRYLIHELFHYAVPQSREKRNYYMACFLLSEMFKMQFVHIFNQMLYMTSNGMVDNELKSQLIEDCDIFGASKLDRILFFTNRKGSEKGKVWLDDEILQFIQENAEEWRSYAMIGRGKDATSSEYTRAIGQYCQDGRSDELFSRLFNRLLQKIYKNFDSWKSQDLHENVKEFQKYKLTVSEDVFDRLFDRFQYCMLTKDYSTQYLDGFRAEVVVNERIFEVYDALWEAVREACVDIAMVTMGSMNLDDYLLFVIQAWKDNVCGRKEQYRDVEEDTQHLRIGMVIHYCYLNNIWKESETTKYRNNFLKKYSWFYAKRQQRQSFAEHYNDLCADALQWWDFCMDIRIDFVNMNTINCIYTYYRPILLNVLDDFNVQKKREELKKLSDDTLNSRLDEICTDIEQNVYNRYDRIINEVVFSAHSNTPNPNSWDNYRQQQFACDLEVSQHFQQQKTFRELAELNRKMQEVQKNTALWNWSRTEPRQDDPKKKAPWEFHAYSVTELLSYLEYCENQIQTDCQSKPADVKEPIWFRGQSDSAYSLTPSIMRRFDKEKSRKYASLRQYQQCEFEEFKYRADGAPELPTGVRISTSDYIALMQHYFVPTTFLDWSENAFSSLYFALEDYFENKGRTKDVALYLFHPKKYNRLCREANQSCRTRLASPGTGLPEWILANTYEPKISQDNSIPNISTKTNESYFQAYLLGDDEFDRRYKDHQPQADEPMNFQDICLPFAIWTSRLNTRIRSQSGIFVAFNLYTLPEVDKQGIGSQNHAFDYISLENIQKNMRRNDGGSGRGDSIFLYKIIIDHSCCDSIMRWLRGMGISRSSVYPELEGLKDRF